VRNNKNKVGEPYAEEKFVIDFDKGIELLKKKGRGRAARTSTSK
jgi:hypothetical protein